MNMETRQKLKWWRKSKQFLHNLCTFLLFFLTLHTVWLFLDRKKSCSFEQDFFQLNPPLRTGLIRLRRMKSLCDEVGLRRKGGRIQFHLRSRFHPCGARFYKTDLANRANVCYTDNGCGGRKGNFLRPLGTRGGQCYESNEHHKLCAWGMRSDSGR